MHAAATEMDVKKAIAAKLNTAQKLKPNSSKWHSYYFDYRSVW